MLNLNGNTAVYMLYAHARIASIMRKVGKDVNEVAKTAKLSLDHPAEVCLFGLYSLLTKEAYLGNGEHRQSHTASCWSLKAEDTCMMPCKARWSSPLSSSWS